eukprot:COSAG02_NODE_1943_length_10309_cov_29.284721_6_plen_187_part_00
MCMCHCEFADPPFLLGVHCVNTDYARFQQLAGFETAMYRALVERQTCQNVRLSWAELESLRGKSSFTHTCDAGPGSSPGTPSGGDEDDQCPCSYSNKIMASAPGFEHLYDSDECDLEAGGYCCGSGLYNNVFPGQCRICEDENTVGCRPSSFYLRRVPEKASGGEMAVVRLTLFSIGAGIAVSWLV